MSAKDDDDGDFEDEYVGDDDDDDEEDFHPGVDDDDFEDEDYDDEDNEEGGDFLYMEGFLSYDNEQRIHFRGNCFHLQSSEPAPWNIIDKKIKPQNDSLVIEMAGPCDVFDEESSVRKSTPRKILVSFTIADPTSDDLRFLNATADEDESEKKPSSIIQVFGSEIENPGQTFEFKGIFAPIPDGKEVKLVCQVRMVNAILAPVASAVAGVASAKRTADDENIDDVDEDGVDYNELIALHEESKLSVDALRKRYREQGQSQEFANGGARNTKKPHKDKTIYGDDDDDDDVEF
jgi:hypothetical protein